MCCLKKVPSNTPYILFYMHWKKSLKIPKGQSETYIEEEQTTQWPKEKLQKDKQRSTKHTYKTKDGVTRTSLKTGAEMFLSILFYSISFQIKMIGHHWEVGWRFLHRESYRKMLMSSVQLTLTCTLSINTAKNPHWKVKL